jgi:hypothetical protein
MLVIGHSGFSLVNVALRTQLSTSAGLKQLYIIPGFQCLVLVSHY